MAEIITGIDIGTSEIKVVVAENRNGHPNVLKVFKEPSLGLKKGAIADLTETVQALSRVFPQIREVSKSAVKNLYINIGTAQVRAQHSRGVAAVSRADSEIYQDDVDRVIRASQILNLGSNRMIVHTITKEFIVDGVGDITEPVGLGGSRLEVTTLVIDAFEPHGSRGGVDQSKDAARERALARSGLTDEGEHLACANLQIDALNRVDLAVRGHEPPLHREPLHQTPHIQ